MKNFKYTITNNNPNTILFNYQDIEYGLWHYQVSLDPGETKHIYAIEGTLSTKFNNQSLTILETEVFPPSITITPTACTDVLVIQICNNNGELDDNFDIYLNDNLLGTLDLNVDNYVSGIFIASNSQPSLIYDTFECPLDMATINYFSPDFINTSGPNYLYMSNVQDNGNGNGFSITIRSYKTIANVLLPNCLVYYNMEMGGPSGESFDLCFNYNCCDISTNSCENGYPYTLITTPYFYPDNGNIIFPEFSMPAISGITNPNTMDINGVNFNLIDNLGNDNTSYFSLIADNQTGTTFTISFTQNGESAVYSGDGTSFSIEVGTLITNMSGTPLTLITSAATDFMTCENVCIQYNILMMTPNPFTLNDTPINVISPYPEKFIQKTTK